MPRNYHERPNELSFFRSVLPSLGIACAMRDAFNNFGLIQNELWIKTTANVLLRPANNFHMDAPWGSPPIGLVPGLSRACPRGAMGLAI